MNSLTQPIGFGQVSAADLNPADQDAVIALALAILRRRHRRGRQITCVADTQAYLRLKLKDQKGEVFGALFLDTRHRLIELVELFQGSVDHSAVHPRVVAQRALELNAAAAIFFHNHPSGVAEPSHSDKAITQRLRDALALVEVRVLDHYVVADGGSVSFAERGLL
jgi:DNA repair protein RadC